MTNVKLSDKSCALCGAKDDTMSVKNVQEGFQAILCQKHMLAMLKKWEGGNAESQTSGRAAPTQPQ